MQFVDPRHDPWRPARGEDGAQERPEPRPRLLLDPAQWQAARAHWPLDLPVGIALPNDADVAELAADLRQPSPVALITLQFPKWTDGRAYTQARLLRVRHGYVGELRAVGEVLADMLPLLQRCGFDAVQLRHDQSVATALRALDWMTGHYQGDLRQPAPAFARDLKRELADAEPDRVGLFAGQDI